MSDVLAGLEFVLLPAEPTPKQDYWKDAALGRIICAAFDLKPRDIGVVPRHGFDGRYRRRQKNRRKRRR